MLPRKRMLIEKSRQMSTLQDIEQLLVSLARAEKAQVLQWLARDLAECISGH